MEHHSLTWPAVNMPGMKAYFTSLLIYDDLKALFFHSRERTRMQEWGEGQRETQRENPKQTLHWVWSPHTRLDPTTHELMSWEETKTLTLNWATQGPQAYFIIKYWWSHIIHWTLYGKWETEWLSVCGWFTLVHVWLTELLPPSSTGEYLLCVSRWGKDQNSESEVQFLNAYCSHTIMK